MGLRPEIFLLRNFYPRPPRGGRHKGDFDADTWHGFLSTPSARRATRQAGIMAQLRQISIHALREEGDAAVNDLLQRHNISIHALREEGDRKETAYLIVADAISIHALREEGDPEHQHL